MTKTVTRAARKPKPGAYDPSKPAAKIIAKFDGQARFCEACTEAAEDLGSDLKFSPSTVYRWLQKGLIPREREPIIMRAAEMREIDLDASEFNA